VIAILSFVCSVGNVPLAAVLWSGGISFAGVMGFIFADLVILPLVAIYRKYYGTRFALRITALMLVAMVTAALVIDALFSGSGLIPAGHRPSQRDVFGSLAVNYKLALNLVALLVFVTLFWVTARRGDTDPVCRMKVERDKALRTVIDGQTYHFCSEHCLRAFEAQPGRYSYGTRTRRIRLPAPDLIRRR
jgi:YHS domain-containing protein